MPALRIFKLCSIVIMSVPNLIRNVRSPGIVSLTVETEWDHIEDEPPSDLADSLSTGTFATTRPHATIVCSMHTDQERGIMRNKYIAALPVLHREGRLDITHRPP